MGVVVVVVGVAVGVAVKIPLGYICMLPTLPATRSTRLEE